MAYERVAAIEELEPGVPLRADLAEPVCVMRFDDDSVAAVHDTCSHQQASLSEGWVDDRQVECPLHGSAFDVDTGDPSSLPAMKPIPVYACKVEDGAVWVDLADQRNDAPTPRH
ncbi:non-heme iron oxygenase ferredoxin subunit [Egibacter rhizosphaerae]|uniref:Non-heme iron oxygenase ferredoxin subunit n=1 Tax=Egibacter rhizosphaerae TaxID=1670831 RepID=A0A411YJN8_9ACTN|nr:non-heme iron oxygenase ferredoxin subunit [Egibacter rhizosphaerae]QBI21406.1 non-heme iron oxygenase ferredoxin subunit [Egibacter rhizosphaerae]